MQRNFFLILFCLFLFSECYSENEKSSKIYIVLGQVAGDKEVMYSPGFSDELFTSSGNRPSPLFQLFHTRQKKNKKLTAALLAFPLPFGIVGLHRIYLGSAPYVPVVYIATFGGALGLLPLIDFCFILLDKNTEDYSNNKKVFMWVK